MKQCKAKNNRGEQCMWVYDHPYTDLNIHCSIAGIAMLRWCQENKELVPEESDTAVNEFYKELGGTHKIE